MNIHFTIYELQLSSTKSYKGKVKSFSLAYKQRETRDSDRSWCHCHTSIKFFWLQPMAPWTSVAAYERAAAQSMGCDQESFTLMWW